MTINALLKGSALSALAGILALSAFPPVHGPP